MDEEDIVGVAIMLEVKEMATSGELDACLNEDEVPAMMLEEELAITADDECATAELEIDSTGKDMLCALFDDTIPVATVVLEDLLALLEGLV